MKLPELSPWNLSLYDPKVQNMQYSMRHRRSRSRSVSRSRSPRRHIARRSSSPSYSLQMDSSAHQPLPRITQPSVVVSNKGSLAATFLVPGLITIPSDGDKHSVNVVRLKLEADILRSSIPRVNSRVHLKVGCRSYSFDSSKYPDRASLSGENQKYL